MKGYGLPRNLNIEFPDLLDIQEYALKTSTGQIKSLGGDYRGSVRTKNRVRNRRYWKKNARNHAKRDLYNELNYLH